jgi:hypothetical protein
MATGDANDFLTRIKALLPNGWFSGTTPILDSILTGISSAFASVYSLIAYARLQTRISTATDGFLDLISLDFFGSTLSRKTEESDVAFRNRILSELFLERGTRNGLIKALTLLTGNAPWVFEPGRPADTGAYNLGVLAYGVAGGYGSLNLPYQAFCVAYRPAGQGIPNIAGYGNPEGAYGMGQSEYINPSMLTGTLSDADIFAAISSVQPVGTIVWTQISNPILNSAIYTDESGFTAYTDESGNAYTTEH